MSVVLCGCLGLVGIGFSTISAQRIRPENISVVEATESLLPIPSTAETSARWPPSPLLADRSLSLRRCRRVRRKGSRTSEEIERARQELWDQTQLELDAVTAEYHALLPREQAEAIGAAYARYSSRHQDSVADQIRELLADAVRRKIFVPREFIFVDLAVRGSKNQRPGLNALRSILKSKAVQVLFLFSTNRLFRNMPLAVAFAQEVVMEWGIRCIYLKNGIDTAEKTQWEMLLQFLGIVDQVMATMNVANIRASHVGLLKKRLVYGTIAFGYAGEPLEGQLTKRKRPRCRLVIDPETSVWVERIFQWFVVDRLKINTIVQRMNADPDIPLSPRCTSDAWSRDAVVGILKNARYRGLWKYGEDEMVWSHSKDSARQRPRPEPLEAIQIEELRIICDEVWFAAQKRLAAEPNNGGRKPKDGDRHSRPKLLNRLFWCPGHNRILNVGGGYGNGMVCRGCQQVGKGDRRLYSHLNRQLALKRTCETLAKLLRQDEDLVEQVIKECQQDVADLAQPNPEELPRLKAQAEKAKKAIEFNRKNVGISSAEQADTLRLIKQMGRDLDELQVKIKIMEVAGKRPVEVPSPDEVRARIDELDRQFTQASQEGSEEQVGQMREILEFLTGGRIDLYQQGECTPHRGWLQGRFNVRLLSYLAYKTGDCANRTDSGIDVIIDYKEPNPLDAESKRAKALYDQGMLNSQIAAKLGCGRNYVTKALRHWFQSRGLPVPDGRTRRTTLTRKQTEAPKYEELAERAKELWDANFADVQIAETLGCSPPTAVAAVEFWHTSRGLTAPGHAERREKLIDRMQSLYEQNQRIRQIAETVGMCTQSITFLLRERYKTLGKTMPDGRTRGAALRKKEVEKPQEDA